MNPEVQVLFDAGLRPHHVSRLLDVHAATVANWYGGETQPHRWIMDRVRALAKAVSLAVDAGTLPVDTPGLTAPERDAKTFFIASQLWEQQEGDKAA